VVLALMGPQWLEARDGKGRRRIDNGADFVRLELRTALARPGVKVVPLLIDGTEMPAEDDLPADLHPLLRRHAMNLRFANFDADMRHMVVHLKRMLAPAAPVAPAAAPTTAAPVAPATPTRRWPPADQRDPFGRWAEIDVLGVVQRLRWIAPGEFWMGSTDEERAKIGDKDYERWARNESPRHRVRLTQGFWLADTACTQALWMAVMGGENPSEFQDDPNNPVERVSWDDVQGFLEKLQGLLPVGCRAELPSEAEWEYACRAGSETAFSFGETITTEQVNYDGNHPYGGGPKGEYRERTVPVKSLPANGWGLYEMHGNVSEWCADGAFRDYGEVKRGEVAENPIQPPEQGQESPRVIRGGCWGFVAHVARSADRLANGRGSRSDALGFRLALRS
jgi:formylglycine-generating enzyme required for sulfatase activity